MEALKEFYIKIDFDTSGFDKLKNATKAMTEKVTTAFKTSTDKQIQIQKKANSEIIKNTKEMGNSQIAIFKNIAKLAGGIFSTAFIKSAVSEFVSKGMEADETSSLLGISPEAFNQISGAFNRFGVESSAMASQLSAFNKQIQQADKGTGRLKIVLDKFGLSIKNAKGETMSADEMLLSMSEQLKGFDAKTRGAILAMMGFDNSIQSAFSDGGDALMGFLAKQKELNLITLKDTEMAKKYTFAFKDMRDEFQRVKNIIARFLLPVFTALFEKTAKLINLFMNHKKVLLAIFSVILIALTPILKTLGAIFITQLKILAPCIAIGAIITGIILLIEDLYYYFKGWDSTTGALVKKFPSLKNALEPVKFIVLTIGQIFEDILNFIKNPSWENFTQIFENIARGILNLAQQWGDVFTNILATSLNGFMSLFDLIIGFMRDIFTNLKNWVLNIFTEIFLWFSEKLKAITEPIKSLKNGITDKVGNITAKVKGFFGGGDAQLQPLPVVNSSNAYATNNYNSKQDINVTINGNVSRANADYFAKSIGDKVNSQQFQNGNTGRF